MHKRSGATAVEMSRRRAAPTALQAVFQANHCRCAVPYTAGWQPPFSVRHTSAPPGHAPHRFRRVGHHPFSLVQSMWWVERARPLHEEGTQAGHPPCMPAQPMVEAPQLVDAPAGCANQNIPAHAAAPVPNSCPHPPNPSGLAATHSLLSPLTPLPLCSHPTAHSVDVAPLGRHHKRAAKGKLPAVHRRPAGQLVRPRQPHRRRHRPRCRPCQQRRRPRPRRGDR